MQIRIGAFVDEVAGALAAVLGGTMQVTAGDGMVQSPWIATLAATGAPAGSCLLLFDGAGIAAFGRTMAGAAAEASDSSIADQLRIVLEQAAAAAAARPPQERLDLTLSTLTPSDALPPEATNAASYAIALPGMASPLLVAAKWLEAAPAVAMVPQEDSIGSRIDVILDIDLPVVVRFGHTEMPLRALTRLGPGSVIDLGRSPDDPVEVLVSNHVVARGEVVIVGGNYGVRILDVTSQSERARSMEA
jgi:flagellar motor switch protein FliN/FliY